eukprot:6071392-Amphidinium_carterae.1
MSLSSYTKNSLAESVRSSSCQRLEIVDIDGVGVALEQAGHMQLILADGHTTDSRRTAEYASSHLMG